MSMGLGLRSAAREMGSPPSFAFALFAYNQEGYVRAAVEGALSQTYSPLEIILSDDCSSDRTFQIMQEMAAAYVGPHSVRCRRSSVNSGLARHINDVVSEINAEYVCVAAGDDQSMPSRVEHLAAEFRRTGAISIFSNCIAIDESGREMGSYYRKCLDVDRDQVLRNKIGVLGASHAFHMDVFRVFGPLRADVVFEDLALAFRAALLGDVRYLDRELIRYRLTSGSLGRSPVASSLKDSHKSISRRLNRAIASHTNQLNDLLTFESLHSDRRSECREIAIGVADLISRLLRDERLMSEFPRYSLKTLAKLTLHVRFRLVLKSLLCRLGILP
ncbi:glycosyltransferase [Candidatus Laterigemmans baculatus]|uniref:glycosyltransferase n=1 Tax=Candidatus Laterigemmans baculatus TaxID=2770505 RepID=UPI0013DAC780|nr:glycosyltransferase [Candidatus Laterigemmans baculatus]